MKTRLLHSLEKIFPEDRIFPESFTEDTALRGETYSFQILLQGEEFSDAWCYRIDTESQLPAEVRLVINTPVMYTGPLTKEDGQDVAKSGPGLYPDLLKPLMYGNRFRVIAGNTPTLLWVTVRIPENTAPGKYDICFKFSKIPMNESAAPVTASEEIFKLTVLDRQLIPQTFKRLEWLHCDCLASFYQVTVWSEEHWKIVENFIANAANHGINILYTPLWTPPLDTEIGYERLDCQLLTISCNENNGKYSFDFSRLERYIDIGLKLGMKYFAMSHIFTQWGAAATPKIIVNGKRRFGWDVPSDSAEYLDFLKQLFPELLSFLRKKGLSGKCYFSISDEPHEDQMETYGKAAAAVRPLLEEFKTLEALSSYNFYQHRLVDIPVPILTKVEDFKDKVPELFGYYCCAPVDRTPNRMIGFPNRRIRSIGILAYAYGMRGFLQWGFNFYYTQYSHGLVNPFTSPDADGAFPAGDPFLVYPGTGGMPWDSIRNELMLMAMQDYRMLEQAETIIGREAVMQMIGPVTMTEFPRNDLWIKKLRHDLLKVISG